MLERTVDEELEQLGRIFPRGPFLDRRLGRALAFQALYEMDLGHHPPSQVLERLSEGFGEASASPYPDEILRDACSYAQQLVRGVLANRTAIDGLIQLRAPLWPLAQMSAVDRNVLRIGLYESLYSNATVPLRTAINEAVELAKLFGSETSAKFVNGVLGRAVEASASGEWPPADSAPVAQSPESAGQAARTEVTLRAPARKISIPPHQPDDQKGALEKTMPASAEERLKKIIAEQLSVSEDEVTPEANFIDDLNADSLDLVELIMSLEEEFNVKISDEDAEKIRTVQDAMDYLHEHGGA